MFRIPEYSLREQQLMHSISSFPFSELDQAKRCYPGGYFDPFGESQDPIEQQMCHSVQSSCVMRQEVTLHGCVNGSSLWEKLVELKRNS